MELEKACLTCFQQSDSNFFHVQTQQEMEVVLRKHLWFTEVDLHGALICQTCWDQVDNFHRFYVSTEELHRNRLISTIVKSEPEIGQKDCLKESQVGMSVHTDDGMQDQENSSSRNENGHLVEPVEEVMEVQLQQHGVCNYKCDVCGLRYSMLQSLNRHVKQKHPEYCKDKQFTCDLCSEKFLSQSRLMQHKLKHGDVLSTMQCPVCQREFKGQKSLNTHLWLHQQKEVSCEICGHKSPNQRALNSHKYRKH